MLDLDAIRARLQEIVPPPWHAVDDEDGLIFIRSETTQEDVVSVMYYWGSAEFIAAAPADMAALLAEVERLRAEVEHLQTELTIYQDTVDRLDPDAL